MNCLPYLYPRGFGNMISGHTRSGATANGVARGERGNTATLAIPSEALYHGEDARRMRLCEHPNLSASVSDLCG